MPGALLDKHTLFESDGAFQHSGTPVLSMLDADLSTDTWLKLALLPRGQHIALQRRVHPS